MKSIDPKSLIIGVLALVLMATSCKESPESAYIGIWEEAGGKARFELERDSRVKVRMDGKLKTTSTWLVKGGKIEVVLPFISRGEETWIFEEKRPGILRHIAIKTTTPKTTTPVPPPRMILERKAK